MPILNYTDRRSSRGRQVIAAAYLMLVLGGLTMVYPFLIMLTGSMSNSFDYNRHAVLPRFLWSREDRFMRFLVSLFPPTHRASIPQLRSYFPDLPSDWQIWAQIGDEKNVSDRWARSQLTRMNGRPARSHIEAAARDYGDFTRSWNVRETVLAYDKQDVGRFLRDRYRSVERFNTAWGVYIDNFAKVNDDEWSGEPIDQQNYVPVEDARYHDLLAFRKAHEQGRFTPYAVGDDAPANNLRPASLRFLWEAHLAETRGIGVLPNSAPFPVPPGASPRLLKAWYEFLTTDFPLRHVQIVVTEDRQQAFHRFLSKRFRNIEYLRRVTGIRASDWSSIILTPTVPNGEMAKVWMDFVRTAVPPANWVIRDTLPDLAFQRFVLRRYGSLQAVNKAYGTNLSTIEQLRIPYREAILVTFVRRELPITVNSMASSYRVALDYLLHQSRGVQNTAILVVLTILVTITVNPLAGYALSRFRLRASEKVIVFCLITMAFPAAVVAIPSFLLLRDLHLLNTFAALVLPGAANGMTIFLFKGFFDSLPQELYEAATIDGAPEWRVFLQISLPLVKPILAVGVLNAFIIAYNTWEWAILVCQDPKMWTIAVWTYQFSNLCAATGTPSPMMAAFVISSLPVLVVFLMCQKVILRGIIIPQMK